MPDTISMADLIIRQAEDRVVSLPEIRIDTGGLPSALQIKIGVRPIESEDDFGGSIASTIEGSYRSALASRQPPTPGGNHLIKAEFKPEYVLPEGYEFNCTVTLEWRKFMKLFTATESFVIRVESEREDGEFPAVLVIDFGNTSSNAVLHSKFISINPRSLAVEQDRRLKSGLTALLEEISSPNVTEFPESSDCRKQIQNLLRRVAGEFAPALPHESPEECRESLVKYINNKPRDKFQVLSRFEIHVAGLNEAREVILPRIHRLVHETFDEPILESRGIYPIPLEWSNDPITGDPVVVRDDIESELQIIGPGKPPRVNLGEAARKNAIDSGEEIDPYRFHKSFKRYLEEEESEKPYPVGFAGCATTVSNHMIVRAALRELVRKATEIRPRIGKMDLYKGSFRKAIVTYPTASAPAVRRLLQESMKALEFTDVRTNYDEAVSAAIFYLFRRFGGSVNFASDAFKARASISPDGQWFQNILVVDIGGGSTDVALIRATLREIVVFEPGEDRGAGGRCYEIEPRVLGSSGRSQLGGDLITLRVFQRLKLLLADALLRAVHDHRLICEQLEEVTRNWPRTTFNESPIFNASHMVSGIDDYPHKDHPHKRTLDQADLLVPTRFLDAPERRRAFNFLMGCAERAKIELGAPRAEGTPPRVFTMDREMIECLIKKCNYKYKFEENNGGDPLSISVTEKDFEDLAEQAIEDTVEIVKQLLEDRLPKNERLDWLILSGRSSNLDIIQRRLRQSFQQGGRFTWNDDNVTFDPKYAKMATAAGAAVAEMLYRSSFIPETIKPELREGFNQLTIEVKNLYFNLPCKFQWDIQGTFFSIFAEDARFLRIDGSDLGKVRSDSKAFQPEVAIMRLDYPDATPITWVSYDIGKLSERIKSPLQVFRTQTRGQFEVDHKLNFVLYLWNEISGGPRHKVVDGPPESLLSLSAVSGMGQGMPVVDRVLKWDITASALPAVMNQQKEVPSLLTAGTALTDRLDVFNPQTGDFDNLKGIILHNVSLPFTQAGDEVHIHVRIPGKNTWHPAGVLKRPIFDGVTDSQGNNARNEPPPDFPESYSFSLDERGAIRLHAGELPYRTTKDPMEWKDNPGYVLVDELKLENQKPVEERDPFCGKH